MDFGAALAVAGQSIGIVKDLRDIDRGLEAAEYKAKMAELYSNLAELRMALSDAQGEVKERDNIIAQLKAAFEVRPTLVFRHGFKYDQLPDGQPEGLPYCPTCEQKEGRYFRLSFASEDGRGMKCPNCSVQYFDVPEFDWRYYSG